MVMVRRLLVFGCLDLLLLCCCGDLAFHVESFMLRCIFLIILSLLVALDFQHMVFLFEMNGIVKLVIAIFSRQ